MTRYRRRDLRNTLESRLDVPVRRRDDRDDERGSRTPPQVPRLKITRIPLDVSDFTIDDMVKEFGEYVYSRFYDHREDRSCIYEFSDPNVMQAIVEKHNNHELNGSAIHVEIVEPRHRPRNRAPETTRRYAPGYGSHYEKRSEKRTEKKRDTPKSLDDLNAELDAYMNSEN